jgi:hypothetical protein
MLSRSFISSDHSDEENELWARTVDLPGFDDNVSPHNAIAMLLRIIVGEVRRISFLTLTLNYRTEKIFLIFPCFNYAYFGTESVMYLCGVQDSHSSEY